MAEDSPCPACGRSPTGEGYSDVVPCSWCGSAAQQFGEGS